MENNKIMEKETLKNIFKFLEKNDNIKAPFIWKLKNNIPLSEEELDVKGYLDLSYTNITSLPEGLRVDGNLYLYDSKIESLPEGLKVAGWLYIVDTKLTKYTDDELREMVKPGFIKGEIRR
jgi:hypothetical protein